MFTVFNKRCRIKLGLIFVSYLHSQKSITIQTTDFFQRVVLTDDTASFLIDRKQWLSARDSVGVLKR